MITNAESGDDSTERTRPHDSYNILRLRCEEIHWLTLLQANLTTGGLGDMGANIALLTGRQHCTRIQTATTTGAQAEHCSASASLLPSARFHSLEAYATS